MYTQTQDSHQSAAAATDSSPKVSEAIEVSSESCVEPKILVPASLRKLDLSSSSEDESDTPEGNGGFRFIDLGILTILTEVMWTFWRPDCRNGYMVMKENLESKKGVATQVILECTARNCKY